MTHAHTSPTAPILLPFPGDEIMAMDPGALTRLWTPARHAAAALGSEPAADYDGDDEDDHEDDGNEYLDNGVAVVCVDGPLMQRGGWWWDGYAAIHSRMLSALTRPGTRALVFKINSPGGVAAGCFEAARQMRADCLAAGVPVLVYADEMACSAAYALACIGDRIWLPPSGCVGSVGVIATYLDATAALKDMGMRYVLATSGAYKADGHPAKAITPEVEARLTQPVTHLAGLFFGWVAERRQMRPDAVAALEAGVLWGRTALAAGLADTVGSYADCLASAAALAATPDPFRALTAGAPLRADASATETPTMTDSTPHVDASTPDAAPEVAPPALAVSEHDTILAALSADLDAAKAQVAALSSERAALMADLDDTRAALTEATAKVKAADTARITAKVDALVGLKITPAEREEHLEMALENEARFDRLMQKRPDLALTDKRLVPDTGNETRATDKPDGPLTKLNALTDAYQAEHPGTPRHIAMKEVMRQRPDLCETATLPLTPRRLTWPSCPSSTSRRTRSSTTSPPRPASPSPSTRWLRSAPTTTPSPAPPTPTCASASRWRPCRPARRGPPSGSTCASTARPSCR